MFISRWKCKQKKCQAAKCRKFVAEDIYFYFIFNSFFMGFILNGRVLELSFSTQPLIRTVKSECGDSKHYSCLRHRFVFWKSLKSVNRCFTSVNRCLNQLLNVLNQFIDVLTYELEIKVHEITPVGNLIIILKLLEPEVLVTWPLPCSGSCSCHYYELV